MPVTVYTSDNCGACLTLIAMLKGNGVEVNDVNVSHDEEARAEYDKLGFIGTPVAVAEGVEPFSGIDPAGIGNIIEKYGE